jgi:hypothetical protein
MLSVFFRTTIALRRGFFRVAVIPMVNFFNDRCGRCRCGSLLAAERC